MPDASENLKALFWVGQDSVDLHCDFVIRRTVTSALPVHFEARHAGTLDLPCEYIVRHNSISGPDNWVKGIFFVVRTWAELEAEFKARRSSSEEFSCELVSRHSEAQDLAAEFIIRHDLATDLVAEFVVRHSATSELKAEFQMAQWAELKAEMWVTKQTNAPCDKLIVDDEIDQWINFYDCIDHGFVDRPSHEDDGTEKYSGANSFKINSDRIPNRYKEIQFGWRSAGPINTCECMITEGSPSCCVPDEETHIKLDWQNRVFIAAGRYWFFHACITEGGEVYYKSSLDGISWTADVLLPVGMREASSDLSEFAACFDGTYLHLVNTYNGLYYVRGKPESDGTITFDAVQTIDPVERYDFPSIEVDSEGYPYIGFLNNPSPPFYNQPWMIKSSRNDGVWSTAAGYPWRLNTMWTGNSWRVKMLRLNDGKMFALYFYGFTQTYGRFYNGSSWEAEENWSYSEIYAADTNHFSAVAGRFFGNPDYDVFLVRRRSSDGALIMVTRSFTYSNGDITGYNLTFETIRDSVPVDVLPALCLNSNGSIALLIIWAGEPDANTIYWNQYSEELGWATSPKVLLAISGTTLKGNDQLCAIHAAEGDLPVLYVTNLSSPNALRLAILSPA